MLRHTVTFALRLLATGQSHTRVRFSLCIIFSAFIRSAVDARAEIKLLRPFSGLTIFISIRIANVISILSNLNVHKSDMTMVLRGASSDRSSLVLCKVHQASSQGLHRTHGPVHPYYCVQ